MIVDTLHNLERASADAAYGSGDSGHASTSGEPSATASDGAPDAEHDPTVSAASVMQERRSAEFRPLALPAWALFALGAATGIVITIILEAVL
jgi:hypothetical protein